MIRLKPVTKWFFSFIISRNIVCEFAKRSRLSGGRIVGTKRY